MKVEVLEAGAKVEILEQWDSPEVEEHVRFLRGEIAKAFIIPAHMTHRNADVQFMRNAIASTERLQAQLAQLTAIHCRPRMLVSR